MPMSNIHYTRPDVAAFLSFLNSQDSPKMEDLPVDAARQMYRSMAQLADLPRGNIAHVEDISISGPASDIPVRIYDNRPDRPDGPVMVFYHGGGWVIGDLDTHDHFCAEAARILDIPVYAIDYRMGPEHPFPAAPEDCEAATRWIAENKPCTGLVLCGDSAGGNLTIVTGLALRDNPADVPVLALHPIYPATSARTDWPSFESFGEGYFLSTAGMAWFNDQYAPNPADRRAAPLDFPVEGLPPTLLVTAGLDPLRDQGRAYAAKLIEAGVPTIYREAKGNIHGYISLAQAIPSSLDDIRGALSVLKSMIAEALNR
jgi:acetyl esterase